MKIITKLSLIHISGGLCNGDMYLITRIISGIVTRMETVSETRVLPSKNDAAKSSKPFSWCA